MFLFGWVHGVAFVDAGNMFPKASDFSLTNLRRAPAAGSASIRRSPCCESISACR